MKVRKFMLLLCSVLLLALFATYSICTTKIKVIILGTPDFKAWVENATLITL
jgi:hypothetical protein